jgi:hypothetical protein
MKVTGTISKAALSLLFAIAAPKVESERQSGEGERQSGDLKEPSRFVAPTEGSPK